MQGHSNASRNFVSLCNSTEFVIIKEAEFAVIVFEIKNIEKLIGEN